MRIYKGLTFLFISSLSFHSNSTDFDFSKLLSEAKHNVVIGASTTLASGIYNRGDAADKTYSVEYWYNTYLGLAADSMDSQSSIDSGLIGGKVSLRSYTLAPTFTLPWHDFRFFYKHGLFIWKESGRYSEFNWQTNQEVTQSISNDGEVFFNAYGVRYLINPHVALRVEQRHVKEVLSYYSQQHDSWLAIGLDIIF